MQWVSRYCLSHQLKLQAVETMGLPARGTCHSPKPSTKLKAQEAVAMVVIKLLLLEQQYETIKSFFSKTFFF